MTTIRQNGQRGLRLALEGVFQDLRQPCLPFRHPPRIVLADALFIVAEQVRDIRNRHAALQENAREGVPKPVRCGRLIVREGRFVRRLARTDWRLDVGADGRFGNPLVLWRRGSDSNPVSPCRICNLQILSCQGCRRCLPRRGALHLIAPLDCPRSSVNRRDRWIRTSDLQVQPGSLPFKSQACNHRQLQLWSGAA
jgi:hypothetical protein